MFVLKCIILLVLISVASGFSGMTAADRDKRFADNSYEYCMNEDFKVQCMKQDIIFIKSALYGRMRVGRCLEGDLVLSTLRDDPRVLGCSVDVLEMMNAKCSGKNQCEFRGAADPDLMRETPCHASLQMYLEVEYECVTVVEAEKSCVVSVSSNPLHIVHSSSSLSKLSCGTKSQPWRLEAPAGQQIIVSLLESGSSGKNMSRLQTTNCHQLGYIIDKSARKNVTICGRSSVDPIVFEYKSSSNVIEIVQENLDSGSVYQSLLRIAATGCVDLIPSENAWLRRNHNEAVVGCYTVRQTWHLRCVESHWVGVMGNCTHELQEDPAKVIEYQRDIGSPNYQVIVIVAIGFLSLVICVVIISCGAVCLQRYYTKLARKYHQNIYEVDKLKNFNTRSSGMDGYKHTPNGANGSV